nr:hypothetical protein [Angustibacter aerolatus]
MRTSDRGRLAVRVTAAALCAGLILLVTGARDEPLGLALLAGVQGLGMLAVLWHRSGRREQQVWAPLAAGSLLLVVTDLPSLAAAPGVTAPGASTLVGALAGCTLWYVGALALLRQRLRSVLAYAALDMLGGVVTMTALAWALAARPLAETVGVPMSTAFALLVAPSATLLLAVFAVTGMFLGGGLRDLRMIASAIAYLLFTLVAMAPAVLPADDHLGPLGAHLLTAGAQVCVLLLLGAASTLPTPSAVVRRDEGRLATRLSPTIFSVVNACLLVACAFDLVPREVAVVACSGLLFTLFKLGTVFRNVTTLNDTRRQAESDELTGLANRRALVQEPGPQRERPHRRARAVRPRPVQGRERQVRARRRRRACCGRWAPGCGPPSGPTSLAVRLGGDEFAVLLREPAHRRDDGPHPAHRRRAHAALRARGGAGAPALVRRRHRHAGRRTRRHQPAAPGRRRDVRDEAARWRRGALRAVRRRRASPAARAWSSSLRTAVYTDQARGALPAAGRGRRRPHAGRRRGPGALAAPRARTADARRVPAARRATRPDVRDHPQRHVAGARPRSHLAPGARPRPARRLRQRVGGVAGRPQPGAARRGPARRVQARRVGAAGRDHRERASCTTRAPVCGPRPRSSGWACASASTTTAPGTPRSPTCATCPPPSSARPLVRPRRRRRSPGRGDRAQHRRPRPHPRAAPGGRGRRGRRDARAAAHARRRRLAGLPARAPDGRRRVRRRARATGRARRPHAGARRLNAAPAGRSGRFPPHLRFSGRILPG